MRCAGFSISPFDCYKSGGQYNALETLPEAPWPISEDNTFLESCSENFLIGWISVLPHLSYCNFIATHQHSWQPSIYYFYYVILTQIKLGQTFVTKVIIRKFKEILTWDKEVMYSFIFDSEISSTKNSQFLLWFISHTFHYESVPLNSTYGLNKGYSNFVFT
jgi:hypothetical protein